MKTKIVFKNPNIDLKKPVGHCDAKMSCQNNTDAYFIGNQRSVVLLVQRRINNVFIFCDETDNLTHIKTAHKQQVNTALKLE